MHHIYHTEGIILGSKNFGEAEKYYNIFTKDLGMITAEARGVRNLRSKLRFTLSDFACVKLDLVQRKNIFRVTTASKLNVFERVTKDSETLRIFTNIARLLKRLLPGTEPNEDLFKDLVSGLSILEKIENKEDLLSIEAIVVLRIIHNLGYIGANEVLENFIKSPYDESIIFEASKKRTIMLSEINKALRETHL